MRGGFAILLWKLIIVSAVWRVNKGLGWRSFRCLERERGEGGRGGGIAFIRGKHVFGIS